VTPYYSDSHVTLYLGDWRELIPECFRADCIIAGRGEGGGADGLAGVLLPYDEWQPRRFGGAN